ncbi:MAG: hypothetical protein ACODAA_03420 [Gemmatimonadota bacterium]
MAISIYELSLAGFRFPQSLSDKRSNFRFVVDVRYVNGRGEFDTAHAVLPDLARWWECDLDRRGEPMYVRGPDAGDFATFDMTAIDAWDRLVLLVRGDGIHSVQFKVFDVDRPDFLDRVGGALGDVAAALIGRKRERIEEDAGVFSGALGAASADLQSALLARLAGGEKLLFRGAVELDEPGDYVVSGLGEEGEYAIRCELKISS